LADYNIDPRDIERAIDCAYGELEIYKNDLKMKAEEMIDTARRENRKIIVLAGRPYHVDPEINHGIPQMISNYGMAVLSEDAIVHLSDLERPLRVVDQWAYHTRLYHAAELVSKNDDMELIQLNSFGCGLDAVTIDQVQELLQKHGKSHTVIKIDEINNLGAARIRVRSLMAVMTEKDKNQLHGIKLKRQELTSNERLMISKRVGRPKKRVVAKSTRVEFTKEMKETHTILAPQMSPIHFRLFEAAFRSDGYKLEVLPAVDDQAIQEGLQYVHNDACYPSIITIGQIMSALKSGRYDLQKTSVIISQTGGGCRATNYIGFLRKALTDAEMSHIPVISLNAGGLEKNAGFKLSASLLNKLAIALMYGDLLMRLTYQVRPYEVNSGDTDALYEMWNEKAMPSVENGRLFTFKKDMKAIVKDFASVPVNLIEKPKVGIVGEILVKYHPTANNNLVEMLENMGAEAIVPDLTDFLLYCCYNHTVKQDLLDMSKFKRTSSNAAIKFIELYRKDMRKALKESGRFTVPKRIDEKAHAAEKIMSLGHQTGEGWFLTAEMIELLSEDVNNVVCLQPFGCLPNHIVGKGMIKALKKAYPKANIAAIDYDPGASEVNQMNRLLLMMTNAKEQSV
jgi:predicted nucleotide-binding protein (sugar kinase/HSP70/actin superfamily)